MSQWRIEPGFVGAVRVLTHDGGDGIRLDEEAEAYIRELMSRPSATPAQTVTTQMLIDVGLNAFGLQLFCESIAGKKDVRTFEPLTFCYRGVRVTIEPHPPSARPAT